jgi:SAM-dependent methyltransferase
MKPNSAADVWNQYFSHRDVSADRYAGHTLPKYLSAVLPRNRDAKIVDLGCGFGQNICAIRQLGYSNCFGVEPSEDAAGHASSTAVTIYRGTIEQYAATVPRDVEFALMTHVLEHIPKEGIIKMLSIIRTDILAPNGVLLVAVPNASSSTHCYWRYEDWTHTCLFTSGSLLYVLRAAGFQQVEILDPDCRLETRFLFRLPRLMALAVYKLFLRITWRLTHSSLHHGSPIVLSFEVKALARS